LLFFENVVLDIGFLIRFFEQGKATYKNFDYLQPLIKLIGVDGNSISHFWKFLFVFGLFLYLIIKLKKG